MNEIRMSHELRSEARSLLNGKWGTPIGVTVILGLITLGGNAVASVMPLFFVGEVFLAGALGAGVAYFYMNFVRKSTPVLEDAFSGFKHIVKAGGVSFFANLFIFLWSLLFIVPGIIAAIRYSQVFYIFMENPEMPVLDILKKSGEMMKGHKNEYFFLQLSFAGWWFLSILTMGLGFLWLIPYLNAANTFFYFDLKKVCESE